MFGFGKMGDAMGLMMKASQQYSAAKSELEAKRVRINAGEEDLTVVVISNGLAEIQSITISPALMVPEQKDKLEELLQKAFNKIVEETKTELKNRAFQFAKEVGAGG